MEGRSPQKLQVPEIVFNLQQFSRSRGNSRHEMALCKDISHKGKSVLINKIPGLFKFRLFWRYDCQ
jgi:hypothetical protein